MTRSRSMTFLAGAAVIPLAALAAGCGGGSSSSAATKAPASAPAATPSTATVARSGTVQVAKTRLGKILVDSRGHTLYLFKKDSGKRSACSGQCAVAWPPLRTSGKPTAGSGVVASRLGTIKRSDGKPQVTYNGHPLYGFVMDHKAGDTNGEGVNAFGARWFVVSPSGNQVAKGAAPAAKPAPASKPAAPAPKAPPAPSPAPKPPAPKAPPANNGIPQNGGGDGDADNSGGPSDGDGAV